MDKSSLWLLFAQSAIQGLTSNPAVYQSSSNIIEKATQIADEMLKEYEKRHGITEKDWEV